MDELKRRRQALGWSRRELAQRADTDPRVLQLLELGLSHDEEAAERVEQVLKQAEVALGLDGPPN
jgi:transcriptional regulator with XRE-family HTH domain